MDKKKIEKAVKRTGNGFSLTMRTIYGILSLEMRTIKGLKNG
jgi:hypothetical protein